jgi:hypothetical protein
MWCHPAFSRPNFHTDFHYDQSTGSETNSVPTIEVISLKLSVKGKAIPVTGHEGP